MLGWLAAPLLVSAQQPEAAAEAPALVVVPEGVALAQGKVHLKVTVSESAAAGTPVVVASGIRVLGAFPLGPGEHEVTIRDRELL